MLTAVVVDDELHSIKTLAWLIKEYCPTVELLQTTTQPLEAIKIIEAGKPDIVFLDIEMPTLNGLELASRIQHLPAQIIFTTAYDQYAIKAIKLNALDYLLKPVQKDELVKAVERVNKQYHVQQQQLQEMANVHIGKVPDKIALPNVNGYLFVKLSDIVRIEAEGSYCTLYMRDDKKFLLSRSIGEVEDLLPEGQFFFRAHKSHIINLHFVDRYNRSDGGEIIMQDGFLLSVSRNKKDEFTSLFMKL